MTGSNITNRRLHMGCGEPLKVATLPRGKGKTSMLRKSESLAVKALKRKKARQKGSGQ
ncbi:hypothetical protein [Solemya velesiana gill symbiont]|uniref:hypothetical protein n=1 Tax=Solemya velesiana gill symbiont TaxID=1918948 RepID=UPI001560AE03|nr:hypothetical protein [Solemya velesiana gill symbiont]